MPLDFAESPVVETTEGKVRGYVFREINVYKGMNYGDTTAGANRFLPPKPAKAWTGVREAVDYGETTPQAPGGLAVGGPPNKRTEIGEDCLVLNVWTPNPDGAKRPVLVWLHGGGFEAGSGSNMLYDGTNLAKRGDVVAVTINHRLNVFGHCHLEEAMGAEYAGSANTGFLDIVAALKWVNRNIAAFGGDPGNVMIYGQSGGGRKVSIAMASKDAKGLFHKGIVQSGSHIRLMTRDRANDLTDRLLKQLGVAKGDVTSLNALAWEDIRRANREIQRETNARFSPTIDDTVFDSHPWDPEAPALSADIPMLVGTCRTELSNQLGTAESTVVRQGRDRILVQYPGLQDTAQLKELRIDESSLFNTNLSLDLTGINLAQLVDPNQMQMAAMGIGLSYAKLYVKNNGGFEKALEAAAKQQGSTPDAVRQQALDQLTAIEGGVPGPDGQPKPLSDRMKSIVAAFKSFISSPGTLTIQVQPPSPITAATGMGAVMDPMGAADALGVTVESTPQ